MAEKQGNPAQWVVDAVGALANRTRTTVSQQMPGAWSRVGLTVPANVQIIEADGVWHAVGSPEKLA